MRIADGRSSFYQWDHDQKLEVPEDCTVVRYDNGTLPEALCCKVGDDGLVDVPNIMLQTAAQIHAYGWNEERKCVVSYACFWVEPCKKPDDYVYTQTDVIEISTEIATQLQAMKDSGELTGPQGPAGPKGDTGPKGDPGDPGEPGPKGDAGYSPVRGVDYWTNADKQEIRSYVDEAILGGEW